MPTQPLPMIRSLVLLVVGTLTVGLGETSANEEDVRFLLDGVAEIAAPGVPGPLSVFSDRAFPVVVAPSGTAMEPVVAAARLGSGRIVAFGHTGYLGGDKTCETGDTGRLLMNAIRWTAGRTGGTAKGLKVAVHRQRDLATYLERQGFDVRMVDGPGWTERIGSVDVLCLPTARLADDRQIARVRRFVTSGGGLIAADLGWGWLQLNRGKTLTADHQGNRLLGPAGIVWADGYLKPNSDAGFVAAELPPKWSHAAAAVEALEAHTKGTIKLESKDVRQAVGSACRAARSLPAGDRELLPKLVALERKYSTSAVPGPKKPLGMDRPLGRLLLTMQADRLKGLPPEKVRENPAARAFPGAVPRSAPRVTRRVSVNTGVPNWHSTGLYAAPGELITVVAPRDALGGNLKVRIGAHNDRLWSKQTWRRCPEICRQFSIDSARTTAANAFGGLIYIEVPPGAKPGTIEVEIRGAVEAPYYQLGKTNARAWRDTIRAREAPWAELATEKVILTLPSGVVRDLDDPEDLMKFWDRVLDCCNELIGQPLARRRPERYVADVQISAGYMHSGYPIMVQMDVPQVMVDESRLTANAHGGVWGLYHEMGHNHQSRDWTFSGTGEVTCNLFTLYVLDRACGIGIRQSRSVLGDKRAAELKAYRDAGSDFETWKRKPFLALIMYVELQEAFGWEAFKQVFAGYRDLPNSQRPSGEEEKRDQWMVRFSRAVNRNLGPFFQSWGVPTSQSARASIAHLPEWMPTTDD